MINTDPLFCYLTVLAIIQPARIQDIEASANTFLPKAIWEKLSTGDLRDAHEVAKRDGLVIPVRRGVFSLSRESEKIVRLEKLEREIDNRRIFLMKAQRKGTL